MGDRLVAHPAVRVEVEDPLYHRDPHRITGNESGVVGLDGLQALTTSECAHERSDCIEERLLARRREPHLLEGLTRGVEVHEIEAVGRHPTEPPAPLGETDL